MEFNGSFVFLKTGCKSEKSLNILIMLSY